MGGMVKKVKIKYNLKPVLKGNRFMKNKKNYDRNRIKKEDRQIKDGL